MIKGGWYCCPVCGWRILPVDGDTVVIGAELFCKKCKTKPRPTIVNGTEVADYKRTDAQYLKGPKSITITY